METDFAFFINKTWHAFVKNIKRFNLIKYCIFIYLFYNTYSVTWNTFKWIFKFEKLLNDSIDLIFNLKRISLIVAFYNSLQPYMFISTFLPAVIRSRRRPLAADRHFQGGPLTKKPSSGWLRQGSVYLLDYNFITAGKRTGVQINTKQSINTAAHMKS